MAADLFFDEIVHLMHKTGQVKDMLDLFRVALAIEQHTSVISHHASERIGLANQNKTKADDVEIYHVWNNILFWLIKKIQSP